MNNSYHLEIIKMYEQIKSDEKHALELRKEEIKNKIPEIDKIEKEIGNLCLNVTMSAFKDMDNREQYLDSLKSEITTLRIKKTELLVENGYPADYLQIHYKCNKCKDTGYVSGKKCSCYQKKLNKLYYKNSDLFIVSDKNNFNNFDLSFFSTERPEREPFSSRDNMKKNYEVALKFMEEFDSINENLLFYGNPGTGKTFLSNCIANELVERGYFVIYNTADDLIKNLRDVRFNNNQVLEDHLINCDLLIIDDLGTEILSDFARSELFNILNTKLLRNKKMIVSTNFSLKELTETYSERITSRLFGNFTLRKFYGKDIRLQKKES